MVDVTNYTDNNISTGMGPSELYKFSPGLLTFAAIITGFIMVIGIFGNLLTVVALLKCPKVRNVAAAFIISLCIADFLFCALVLPFAISGFWTRTWSHGGALCQLVPFLRYGNVGVSLLSIGLITLNRYIMIAHHSWYSRVYVKHNIALMIVFSWMFSYGMQTPTLVGVWGKFDYDPELGTCSILPDDSGRSSKTALFVIAFIVPALLIIICYARIFWVVHSSEQRMRKHHKAQSSGPETLNNSTAKRSTVKDNRDTKARRNEWRITKMVLAIFLSFLVCYLPITIAKVADSHVHYPVFHIAGYLLLYGSACVNPIIYVIMNAQYRAAYAAALCCPLSHLARARVGLTSEMERPSCKLQQHTNGAQSSLPGGVKGRPAGEQLPLEKVVMAPRNPEPINICGPKTTGSTNDLATQARSDTLNDIEDKTEVEKSGANNDNVGVGNNDVVQFDLNDMKHVQEVHVNKVDIETSKDVKPVPAKRRKAKAKSNDRDQKIMKFNTQVGAKPVIGHKVKEVVLRNRETRDVKVIRFQIGSYEIIPRSSDINTKV